MQPVEDFLPYFILCPHPQLNEFTTDWKGTSCRVQRQEIEDFMS